MRDVAAAHLRAMTSPEAAGERFIVSGQVVWFADIAHMSPDLQGMLPLLGRSLQHSPAKASRLLGWTARPAASTVVDSARCLLARPAS